MNNGGDSIGRLRTVLRLNSASCILCGLALVIRSNGIAAFLGDASPLLLLVVGVVLIFNGLHLILASRREALYFYEVAYFALGDYAWVITTIVLVVAQLGITTTSGIILSFAIAAMVGAFGLLQTGFAIAARKKRLFADSK